MPVRIIGAGRSAISAIDTGFTKAIGTITDSNLTTLIAAAVLFFLGTGPIRGFAITLAIGIITSMFTSVTGTHSLVALIFGRSSKIKSLSV